MHPDPGFLPNLPTRDDYVDFLEGYALPTVEDTEARRSSRKLVKTYLLETVGSHDQREAAEAFPGNVRPS